MESTFAQKQELAKIYGFREWLYFTTIQYGSLGFRRIDIYSGEIQIRRNRKWMENFFKYGMYDGLLESFYGEA